MWGTGWRQRLRLLPMFAGIAIADFLARPSRRRLQRPDARHAPGISVVIPERDSPDLLRAALSSLYASFAGIDEPRQVIVVVNGAPRETYAALAAEFKDVEWIHRDSPLGFSAAIELGLEAARHDWTLLLNNDMTLEAGALPALAAERGRDVFAIAAQIMQRSADGRREETGFVDWYVDESGVRAMHSEPTGDARVRPHLAASGGATLFRTAPLASYVRTARCYDPFYWEDIEWGVRAWRDGWRVLFCPQAIVHHRHRASTSRFYDAAELSRIAERNRHLFDARNAASGDTASVMMQRICGLPYASQREFSRPRLAFDVMVRRWHAKRSRGLAPPSRFAPRHGTKTVISPASFSYRLRVGVGRGPGSRPRVLVVSPFGVFPPLHGGARRISGLLRVLRESFDVILISDEARDYDGRSLAHFDGLYAVHLVQRQDRPGADRRPLRERMHKHVHPVLVESIEDALRRFQPAIVQIEHLELADLVACRKRGPRWVLGLHDAFAPGDFRSPAEARRFVDQVLLRYDAVTVCSPEDAALIHHRRTVCVPNGTHLSIADYRPSSSRQLLFVGPFRYRQNRDGIREFLGVAWPAIRASVPDATLRILGGDGAKTAVAGEALFAQAGVEVLGSREDIAAILGECALTINPLSRIRGSALKLIESLTAGRVCVSTVDGARGYLDDHLAALVTVPSVEAMIAPIVELLPDDARRRALEIPDAAGLAKYQWEQCASVQTALYRELIG